MSPAPAKVYPSQTGRIATVDGFRAIAVLGVLYAHSWLFTGDPPFILGHIGFLKLDVQRLLSVFGTGVDVFFMISGFCIHNMLTKTDGLHSVSAYGAFVFRRWTRLAPAYYACLVATIFLAWFTADPTITLSWKSTFFHLGFLQTYLSANELYASHFWSLSTEWEFYLVFPLLFTLRKWLRWPSILGLGVAICLGLRLLVYTPGFFSENLIAHIPARLAEFLMGVGVSVLRSSGTRLPKFLCGNLAGLCACMITFLGRVLMTREAVSFCGAFGALSRTLGEPVLTFGCALLLWNVLNADSIFSAFLSWKPLVRLGQWSYSFYLWHWCVLGYFCDKVTPAVGGGVFGQYVAIFLSIAVLVPLSALSYRLWEAPFLKRKTVTLLPVEQNYQVAA